MRKRKEIQGGRGFAAIEDERGETEEKEGREGQDAVRMGRGRREGDGGQRQSGGMAIEDRMRDAERNPSMGGGRGGSCLKKKAGLIAAYYLIISYASASRRNIKARPQLRYDSIKVFRDARRAARLITCNATHSVWPPERLVAPW